jgi:hypothetical protein
LVSCWGDEFAGELGHAGFGVGTVAGVSGATAVAAGFFHSCAIIAGGAVSCWGGDTVFQVGSALEVPGLSGAASISANYNTTCVTLHDGSVSCWADNTHGLTGGTPSNPNWKPTKVTGLGPVTALADPCAITSGTIACFQITLNAGGDFMISPPSNISGLGPAQAISTSADAPNRCALLNDGSVWCWMGLPAKQVIW